jgi:hypothetical protein
MAPIVLIFGKTIGAIGGGKCLTGLISNLAKDVGTCKSYLCSCDENAASDSATATFFDDYSETPSHQWQYYSSGGSLFNQMSVYHALLHRLNRAFGQVSSLPLFLVYIQSLCLLP